MTETKVVWLIEIRGSDDERWVALYEPCYSRDQAYKKQATKARIFGADRVRVGRYVKDNEP